MQDTTQRPVIIVGAGPYGLSIAAHLANAGLQFRIFGTPMSRWLSEMPEGMFLKSEGFASNLSDPGGRHTLEQFCSVNGFGYRATGQPVPLHVFTNYGLDFQRALVPNVEDVRVTQIERGSAGFVLRLNTGETVRARNVILATGLEHTAHVPAEIEELPSSLLSHSSQHHSVERFRGQDVTVIGAGQSAIETAALLHEEGANVTLVARARSLCWNAIPKEGPRSRYNQLIHPSTGLGSGLQLWVYANAPELFRLGPAPIRFERLRKVLGPAGAWWLKQRVAGRFPIVVGCKLISARAHRDRAIVEVARADGQPQRLPSDHVIAATGYRFALNRLSFLAASLRSEIRTERQWPVLSPQFESSVSGLYFTGFSSAASFGPVMRFLYGAEYTARCICRQMTTGGDGAVKPARSRYQSDELVHGAHAASR